MNLLILKYISNKKKSIYKFNLFKYEFSLSVIFSFSNTKLVLIISYRPCDLCRIQRKASTLRLGRQLNTFPRKLTRNPMIYLQSQRFLMLIIVAKQQ
ncbi:hypothetical protein NC653_025532 [Populus alba x Populus x berolinensis]|uniref:Uncharacterized protein n=1 Tax=Populus alba x Populus x berolinensis TaxID=444605 RepID=A0AAD6Q7V3_9ROSI|nr:hypothetical protein NC653_025532 [Populus alba x Populus x berolinensis]